MRRRPAALAVAVAAALALGTAPGPAAAAEPAPGEVEPIFDAARGLAPGWRDWGWTAHTLERGAPAALDLASYGGLLLARPGRTGTARALTFRYRAPAAFGSFLEVRVESASGVPRARVRVDAGRGRRLADGFVEVTLPAEELDPRGEGFERVVFHAWRQVSPEPVLLDRVALVAAPPVPPPPARPARFALDCAAPGRAISDGIYGVGGAGDRPQPPWDMGATARRWGGNASSRFNWELGDAFNTSHDWFFRNVRSSGRPGFTWETFLDENRAQGVRTALTVPILGWVAKDTTSYAFPVSTFGPQQAVASDAPDAGNGIDRAGRPLPPGPPSITSVAAPPEFVERWVRAIRARDGRRRSVDLYVLDNEPTLWHETHRDVHPEPVGYDELLERTLAYAAAVRRADPGATIAGPAEWGWLGYHYSGRDKAAGVALRPDRRAHGDVPLIPWYLRQVAAHERRTGARVLDVLDVHYYPAARGVGTGVTGGTDPVTAALRLRATRSLWDPSYVDESWIREPIRLVPRLREWIAAERPGLGIAIGEWNFGAERHMSGGLAVAEALGRFGTEGVSWAFYWTSPPEGSPAYWAFRAYRDFDGAGGHFLERSVPVGGGAELASLFASRDAAGGRAVLVLLNLDPAAPLEAHVDAGGCGRVLSARAFAYRHERDEGLTPRTVAHREAGIELVAPPYSITVVDLKLAHDRR